MCTRRYISNYTDEIVDKKTIEHILDIVRYVPSGVNNQPVPSYENDNPISYLCL
ncbi:nitroreductase family protein [Methanolobus psychrotolerans]|uniref:nitroreductase family protein n=1 Tax=Methanolobus psychrotolerans TaxID=1874706 RepID=UPI0037441A6C